MLRRRRNSIERWRCCTPSNSITPFKDSTQRSKVIRLAESRTGESHSASGSSRNSFSRTASRRYSDIAPDAPHALHMPSHTFTRVGYWQNSIDSNRAAAAASRRVGQTAEELHASDYQVYAYLQTAQDEAARKVLEALPEIASRFDPRVVVSGAAGPDAGYFALAAIPARYAVERRDWQRATELQPRETPFPYTDAITWFARGIAAARLHDAAKASVAALQDIRTRLEKAKESYWAGQAEIQRLEVNAWSSLTEGRKDLALTTMKSA